MSKKERNFLFCGCVFSGLLGGGFKAFLGYTPNVIWFDAYKTLSALSNCIQYPTNPY